MTKITKGDINRLGDKIRNEYGNISDGTIQELENYRTSHKDSLAKIFRELCRIKYKVGRNTIVTYRIKRFESIITKLHRFPKMELARMWDIGGCRCIVNSDSEVYKLKDEISKILNIKKTNDWIEKPQNDGYKSLHLYVSLPNDDKTLEIQIRNQNDHNWATLVEISDLLFDSGLKEYGRNEELFTFHKLLSKRRNLNLKEKKIIAKISKKYKYIDKLSEVFVRNHLRVREQWLYIETKARYKYFLIEASKVEVPKIAAYDNFEDAERDYFNRFKNNQKANIVLTHLPKPNYNQISIAYSNYILTYHSFEDESSLIFESLIIESLKNGKYLDFFSFFDYYQNIVISRINNSVKELIYSKSLTENKSRHLKKEMTKKEREWQGDISKELRYHSNKINSFQEIFREYLPKKGLNRFVVKRMVKYVFWKQKRRMKKLNAI
ncbi:RelA/SpoT domain-containing protein [Neotamlana nanhaiensis]|uniref:RelA/SpoT domain-containing protein n=1 Tax=Neotamlana nanhaiensis TaxID=1382798 RepID=UPI000699830C|nr:RelA/SpoT domain-containing protein [Tamlana nanhaiensis]